jgi:hypothetical protein
MLSLRRVRFPSLAMARFEIGDSVLIQGTSEEGVIIGVRYGEPAYDVRCRSSCFRNLLPGQIRHAPIVSRQGGILQLGPRKRSAGCHRSREVTPVGATRRQRIANLMA